MKSWGDSRILGDSIGPKWDENVWGRAVGQDACAVTDNPTSSDTGPGTWETPAASRYSRKSHLHIGVHSGFCISLQTQTRTPGSPNSSAAPGQAGELHG